MRSSPQRDFHYYQKWTYYFPTGLLAAVLTTGLLVIIATAVARKIVRKYRKKSRDIWRTQLAVDGARDVMLRTTNFLLFEFEYEKAMEKHVYMLYKVRVYNVVMQYLFIVLLTVISVCVLSFWNTFLAEASIDQCDEFKDCFPMHRANNTPIETTSIINCDEYQVNEDVTILCFELVYRYSEGLGEAGGFLFSMQVITNILIYTVVRIVRAVLKITKIVRSVGELSKKRQANRHVGFVSLCAKAWAIATVLTGYILVAVLLPVWLLNERQEFWETLRTPQRQFQLILYEYTIFILFLVPPIVGGGIYGQELYDTMDVKPYNSGTGNRAELAAGPDTGQQNSTGNRAELAAGPVTGQQNSTGNRAELAAGPVTGQQNSTGNRAELAAGPDTGQQNNVDIV